MEAPAAEVPPGFATKQADPDGPPPGFDEATVAEQVADLAKDVAKVEVGAPSDRRSLPPCSRRGAAGSRMRQRYAARGPRRRALEASSRGGPWQHGAPAHPLLPQPRPLLRRPCAQVASEVDTPDLSLKAYEGLQESAEQEIKTVTHDNEIYQSASSFEELGLSPELLQVRAGAAQPGQEQPQGLQAAAAGRPRCCGAQPADRPAGRSGAAGSCARLPAAPAPPSASPPSSPTSPPPPPSPHTLTTHPHHTPCRASTWR
jgi:hypothetical protein